MKNKWFYPGLFWETVRQLRLIGITALVILELGSLCLMANHLINGMAEADFAAEQGSELVRRLLEVLDVVPLLLVIPALLAPVMTLYVFHHLNKRNAGDFYHALPCKRQALFLSQLAAVALWIAGILAVHTLLSVALMLCMSAWYAINLTAIAVMAFNCLSASLLVVSGIALAMSLTGTLFTNIVASALILFGPRIAITFVTLFLRLPTITTDHLLWVLDGPYNLVGNVPISLFNGTQPSVVDFLPGGWYTLFLAVLHAGLALWAFCRRQSECAGRSAGSRLFQTVFRLSVTMLLCLIPCGLILTCVMEKHCDSSYVLGIVATYIIALIGYFLYELITTRKLRNLVRSLPALGVLAVLNLVLIFGAIGLRSMILHRDFSPEQVASVSIKSEDDYDSYYGDSNYFEKREDTVAYTDETVITLLTDRFTENNRLLRQSEKKYFAMNETCRRYLVQFRLKNGGVAHRYVWLTQKQQQTLLEQLAQNEQLRQVYRELPMLDGVGNTCTVGDLNRKDSETVYRVLQEELKTVPFSDWYGYWRSAEVEVPCLETTVWLTYTVGVENSRLSFNLPLFLEKTCNTYLELMHRSEPNAARELATAFRTYLNKFREEKIDYDDGMISYIDLTILPMGSKAETLYSIGVWEEDDAWKQYDTEGLADLLDRLAEYPATEVGPMYYVMLSINDGEDYFYHAAYLTMPNGEVDEVLKNDAYLMETEQVE